MGIECRRDKWNWGEMSLRQVEMGEETKEVGVRKVE